MGSTALKVLQIGKESTFGTSVAATAKFMGLTDLSATPLVTVKQSRYMQGDFAPSHTSRVTDKRASATTQGDFTYEDMPMILTAAVKGGVTGTGAGGDKTWTFPFPLTSNANVDLRTLEFYDGNQEYEIASAFVESFTISGSAANDGLVTFSANWLGRELTKSTMTGALTNRAVETLAVGSMALKIDDFGGTIATTGLTASLIDFNFTYNTGIHFKKFSDGDVRPSAIGYGVPSATLAFSLEFNANAITELDKYIAGTGRLIELSGTGSVVGAGVKTLKIQTAGDITSVGNLWGDRDGNTTLSFTNTMRYDSATFANFAKIIIINGNSANPG